MDATHEVCGRTVAVGAWCMNVQHLAPKSTGEREEKVCLAGSAVILGLHCAFAATSESSVYENSQRETGIHVNPITQQSPIEEINVLNKEGSIKHSDSSNMTICMQDSWNDIVK